jgi:hypothetical protein
VTKVVGNELQATKEDGFPRSMANIVVVVSVGNEREFRWINHQNVQRKSVQQIPLLGMKIVGVFCTDKLWGRQDHAFQF